METQLEYILTHSYKSDMISYVKSHPEHFEELLHLSLANKQPYSWRAAWLLWSCMEHNDQRVVPYTEDIMHVLTICAGNQARELLMVIQRLELSKEVQGQLFETSLAIWKQISEKPSVRFNAYKVMVKIGSMNNDLVNEIKLLTENQYLEGLSANALKSIFKMLAAVSSK